MNRIALVLDSIATRIGAAVAWLGIPLMIGAAALEPIARWSGWSGDAPFGEASTVAFLAATMASFGYGYATGWHVRLDVLSRRFPRRVSAALELGGTLLVVLPLCALVVVDGIDSTWRSFAQGERWAGTAWQLQWAVRIWVPAGFALLLAAASASALRALVLLFRK